MNTDNLKIPLAVAISYDDKNPAPKISATGSGLVAERILKIAKEHNVEISKNPVVVAALIDIPIGDEIPEIMFQAVAIILAPLLTKDDIND